MFGRGVARVIGTGRRIAKAEREFHERVGKHIPKDLTMAVAKRLEGPAKERLRRARTIVGRGLTLGTAAGATGVAGAGYAAGRYLGGRSKESLDEMALQVAAEMVQEMGFDPTTGEKLAGAYYAGGWNEDEIAERAIELMAEAGYLD
jgi:hypothetical protein